MPDDQPDLFPEAKTLSPKLEWLQRNGVKTWRSRWSEDPEPWCCGLVEDYRHGDLNESNCAFAATEDEAITAWCLLTETPHWTVERAARDGDLPRAD